MYIENPKTKGSGIVCCIPQEGICPNGCEDCFFQSGRSYLDPLEKNLPNMPTLEQVGRRVVRVNDGNDSSVHQGIVMNAVKRFPLKFYNTASPTLLDRFDAPIVLTVNPGTMTDTDAYLIEWIPKELMFVRFRVNTWNLWLADNVVKHYSAKEVPIVLTFMTYSVKKDYQKMHRDYAFRRRTLNSYWAITTSAWETVMDRYRYNKWVYSCGKIEGELGTTACRHCGNCLREFFATMERMEVA